jgi:hypothetical protein
LCSAGQVRQPDTVFSVDVDWLGGAVSYARERGAGSYWGVGAGIGGALWNRMLLAGRHFADEDGPSYEPRDGATDKELVEILHVEVFRRWVPSRRWSYDVGLRASAMVHFDSSDDDPAVPLFGGAYAGLMVGGPRFKVGPRVLVGMFVEGGATREWGVYLVPLSGRVSFGW